MCGCVRELTQQTHASSSAGRSILALALVAGASAFSFTPVGTPSVVRRAHSSAAGSLKMVVAKKDAYKITSLPGDGIGPEIMEATKKVCEAVAAKQGFKIEFTDALIGGAALDACDDPFPDETYKQMVASDSVLLAAIGGPKWDKNDRNKRPETGLLKMRKSLGLFANLRPAVVLPQLVEASTLKPEVVSGVDIMVVRELTGDVYFGEPKGLEQKNGERFGFNNMCYRYCSLLTWCMPEMRCESQVTQRSMSNASIILCTCLYSA